MECKGTFVTQYQKMINLLEGISSHRVEIDSKLNNSYMYDYQVLKSSAQAAYPLQLYSRVRKQRAKQLDIDKGILAFFINVYSLLITHYY